MAYDQITYEVEGAVATITLDRPEKLNAVTVTMAGELLDALDRVDSDDSVRAAIVTGRGRAFCAGADLSAGPATFDAPEADGGDGPGVARDGGGLITLRIFELTKPIIAAVNGAAVGVGVTMTLPMDVRLASEDARFGFVFARRGLIPEAASSWFLPRLVGISRALEWVYSGRVFDAAEAVRGGLVKEVVPSTELMAVARGVAAELTENSSAVSVALTRRLLWRMLGASHPMEAHRADSRGIAAMGRSADAREGIASFLEKRRPAFSMSVSRELPDIFPGWHPPPFE